MVPRCLKSTQWTSPLQTISTANIGRQLGTSETPLHPLHGWVQAGRAGAALSSARLAGWCPRAVCIFHIALVQRSINTCVANEMKRPTACCAGLGNEHGFYHSGSPSAELRGHPPQRTQPRGEVCSSSARCPHCQCTWGKRCFPSVRPLRTTAQILQTLRHTQETPQRKGGRVLGTKVFMGMSAWPGLRVLVIWEK